MKKVLGAVKLQEKELVNRLFDTGFRVFKKLSSSPRADAKEAEDDDEVDLEKSDGDDQQVQKVTREEMGAKDAFFSLIAIKMNALAQQYGKPLDELHMLFFQVSCDFQVLEEFLVTEQSLNQLMGDNSQQDMTVQQEQERESYLKKLAQKKFDILEDLAVKDDQESESYQHVILKKGLEQVTKRRQFLEIEFNV
mmetsp:Transcript_18970/g.32406  ORF Transcript_18970/g.32406 Transcript_18970/m.32406 type:complete len:194 (-) Transcript_18970:17-598(-)